MHFKICITSGVGEHHLKDKLIFFKYLLIVGNLCTVYFAWEIRAQSYKMFRCLFRRLTPLT